MRITKPTLAVGTFFFQGVHLALELALRAFQQVPARSALMWPHRRRFAVTFVVVHQDPNVLRSRGRQPNSFKPHHHLQSGWVGSWV